jgi:all-trans-retinol dehydrogenase (NAD+)
MAKKDHGHFLIIASQTGHLATAGVVDYAATKAACIAIYEGLQTEMKHYYKAPSVRISCISPSAVKTKMFDGIKDVSNFFLPQLTPDDVGGLIAETLWKGDSANLMIPAAAYISVISRFCPEWMRVGMQDGGADIMTQLTPHKPLD